MIQDNSWAVIEALLFSSEKPLTIEQIKNVLDNLETLQIRRILEELSVEYEKTNRGLRIIEVAGGYRMVTPPTLSHFLKKLYKQRRAEKSSRPALETLAIIAYKQPVTKLEIESLRNVNVDGVIHSLLEKDLIHVAGRKNSPGRPLVYGTTKSFLEYFGLKSLDDLPKIDTFPELKPVEEKKENGKEGRDELEYPTKEN